MTYLDDILARRRRAVAAMKAAAPFDALRARALARADQRDFAAALRAVRPALIAEFKRASPSAGTIAGEADPATVAAAYERGGAAAISVLTEPERFNGSFGDLQAARAAASLPVLCKDFVVEEFQVWEAAAQGADALLLIVAALDAASLTAYVALCARLRISALVEVHDPEEARRAVGAGARIVGVNNRDLRTFDVDLSTIATVRPAIPPGVLLVAESGYRTAAQIAACVRDGADAVLVGEALMREGDPAGALRALRASA